MAKTYIDTVDLEYITPQQAEALTKIQNSGNYSEFGKPYHIIKGDEAILVECFYPSGNSIVIGVEPDGHAHS
jgi:hypothetical protein